MQKDGVKKECECPHSTDEKAIAMTRGYESKEESGSKSMMLEKAQGEVTETNKKYLVYTV